MPPTTPPTSISLLVARANHLEDLLVSNLFGLLLTASLTIVAALYELRSIERRNVFVTPRQLFMGISVFYVFLSGYYYFMLAQFYACIVTLVPIAKGNGVQLDTLWSPLRIPSFGFIPNDVANFLMLVNAPLLPLLFSVSALLAFRRLLHRKGDRPIGIGPTLIGVALQVVTCATLTTVPFAEFIDATL